jgi:hypothetical protein
MLAPWTIRGRHMGKLDSLDKLFTGRHSTVMSSFCACAGTFGSN